jgi:hypothetical protein
MLFERGKIKNYLVGTFLLSIGMVAAVYGSQLTDALIKAQNFTQSQAQAGSGVQYFKYQTDSEDLIETEAEFDSFQYSTDSFEVGEDDLQAQNASPDYLELNHYGDNPPDTSVNDWWDDDGNSATKYNWLYRKCFEVDFSAGASPQTEYQIYLDFDTQSLVTDGKMQNDGDDIRVIDSNGNQLSYFIADDMNSTSTRVWVMMDNINTTTEDLCLYYGNAGASSVSSREDVFTYTNPQTIYYVVADSADGSVTDFSSYIENNSISIASYNDVLDKYGFDSFPSATGSLGQTSVISAMAPINATFGGDGGDSLVPSSFAGTSFVYSMDRYLNEFSFMSPWCNANVVVRNGSNNIVTGGSFTINQGLATNLTTSDNATSGLPNDSVVIIEVTNGCPILATHHSTTGADTFVLIPAALEWYGVGSGNLEIAAIENTTNVTVYRSDGTTYNQVINRGGSIYISDAGSEGSEPAHRVVADKPIGVKAIADSDGGESITFLPVDEMGYKYYIPQDTQYIAISTIKGVPTTVDLYNNGSTCGVGVPDNTQTVSPSTNFPGKVYFGSTTDGVNIAQGACIVANNQISAYFEYATQDDEQNIWSYKQNRQFVYQKPTYVYGTTEVGAWDLGQGGTNLWTRRIPVTITNNYSATIDEYQVKLDISSLTGLFSMAQSNGGDIRYAGSLGNGTDNGGYWIENYDSIGSKGQIWVKSGNISAGGNQTMYLYFRHYNSYNVSSLNPLLWLDAADSSTITSSGGLVSLWEDKSVNGHDAIQTNSSYKPEVASYNGLNIIRFDGDVMTIPGGILGTNAFTDITVYGYFKNNQLPENGALFSQDVQGGTVEARAPSVNSVRWMANTNWLSNTYNGDTTNYHAMRFESFTGVATGREVYRDNSIIASSTTANSFTGNNSTMYIGSDTANANRANTIDMAEFIVFSSKLTAAQISNLESYFAKKWSSTQSTSTLTTTGNYYSMFKTSTPKPNYYVVDSWNLNYQLQGISFENNNTVNDGSNSQIYSEGQIFLLPIGSGISRNHSYTVNGPIHADFQGDTTDSAIPITYAGKEFVSPTTRNSDVISLYAPFATANVQIQESSGSGWTTLQSVVVVSGSSLIVSQDINNSAAVRIISDQDILAFVRADNADARTLYPTRLALEQDNSVYSTQYELYGVGSATMYVAAANNNTNVTLYRSNGTSSSFVLNAANNFTYSESGGGNQGLALGYRIVANGPIGAVSVADADGNETSVFLGKKEFSDEYILSSPAQYMGIVATDPDVTCRVFNQVGVEVTSGPASLDYVPPQTGGVLNSPYPNKILIGGTDTSDGAFFSAGYSLRCNEPVYAYFERHTGVITDETMWLTWPQVRRYVSNEPSVQDVDLVNEEGLYYESGFDSAGVGSDPVAVWEVTFDQSAAIYGEHVFWSHIMAETVFNTRSSENSVGQLNAQIAYADSTPNCASATYSTYINPSIESISLITDTAPPNADYSTRVDRIDLPDEFSDHQCVRMRVYFRTGDEAYSPSVNSISMNYSIPVVMEGQIDYPTISIAGNSSVTDRRRRIMKIITSESNLLNSESYLTFRGVSNGAMFNNADFEILELSTNTINPQFNFPAFPATPPAVNAGTTSIMDSNNSLAVYFTHRRTGGASESIDMSVLTDIIGAGGPNMNRDFELIISP